MRYCILIGYFNPRSRVGNDIVIGCIKPNGMNFNPRSRVGNDKNLSTSSAINIDFNPRSRVGNDIPLPLHFNEQSGISIHVPAWGTTNLCRQLVQIQQYFNPRSRVGNDGLSQLDHWQGNRFQSTFPRGERQQILTIFHLYIRISNPNLHFNITPFHIFYLIHFFWACFFQLFMVRIFWGFSVYFWFALYRNNT